MKVSQLVQGERYESKDGEEIREITSFASDGTLRYIIVPIVANATEARSVALQRRPVHEASKQDFATWAARKAGTSTHRSVDGMKFMRVIQGPTG